MEIKVAGFKLVNIPSTATFTFPQTKTDNTVDLTTKWGAVATNVTYDYSVPATKAVTLPTTGSEYQSIMFSDAGANRVTNPMLIPQQLKAWAKTGVNGATSENLTGAYLSVLIQVSSIDGSNKTQLYPKATPNGTGKFAYAMVPIDTNWKPGIKYIYKLKFFDQATGGGIGQHDPNPVNPDTTNNDTASDSAETGNTDDNNDGTKDHDGENILGKPITFTVTVDDWENAAETPLNMN